jgi:hypothetical protein
MGLFWCPIFAPNPIGFTHKAPIFRCCVPISPGVLFLLFTINTDADLFKAMPFHFACDSFLLLFFNLEYDKGGNLGSSSLFTEGFDNTDKK